MNHTQIFQSLILDQQIVIGIINDKSASIIVERWAARLDKIINRYEKAVADLQDSEQKIPREILDLADSNNSKIINEYETLQFT